MRVSTCSSEGDSYIRDWLVVLKDGTRVKVRAAYCEGGMDEKSATVFVDSDDCPVAEFVPGTVAYYFDAATCTVIVEGLPAMRVPSSTELVPEWLKPPYVFRSGGTAFPYEPPSSSMTAGQDAIQTPHDGGRNAT